ncbi:MAG TPA: DNA-binding protein [Phycisphaerales bacterium]|nr:DNA-binding protein [Phycisphaerales bacterium]HCD31060.1 DNA-binding protein [Phycisphaerales bacterium]|tara:strand:- start:1726 stop:1950 length:225 start_codon:yes stop_codon:yes gene_type:complete
MSIYRDEKRPIDQPLVVDTRQAAKMLCISERTLAELKKQGQIPFIQIGRSVRYAIGDLEAWLKSKTQRPESGNV